MSKRNVQALSRPEAEFDPVHELIRLGLRLLILCDTETRAPKVRERNRYGSKFNSQLLPPHLERATRMDELISCRKGNFQEVPTALMGGRPKGCRPVPFPTSRASGKKSPRPDIGRTLSRSVRSSGESTGFTAMLAWMIGNVCGSSSLSPSTITRS